ncbi:NAD(P)-binding domain-containing protein [Methylocella sp.]|uniref:NAD(P)-binding domain-containing protein n=1 Tax=Methylocella sp. TaxID=1978226 RepID=UPI0037837AF3
MTKRIAVIGAGPSGLAVLRAFESARQKGAEVPEMVCYEKQSNWGGLWNYTWRTGLDEFGEPVHGSMYRYLWSNGPKECLEFADYSFEEHFGRPIPSYPPRAVLHDYIAGRVERSGVRKFCKFNHAVRDVDYDAAADSFDVTVNDLVGKKRIVEKFDYVFVCNGHFSTPNVPVFEGVEKFLGRVLHAHDFRCADEFAGKHVLLIGSSYSAEDIATQCHKYGAKRITFSYRSKPMGFKWPEGFEEKPLLTRVVGRACHFIDGSSVDDVDAIVFCTGYLNHYPFLPDALRLETRTSLYPPDLYKGIFWIDNPKLMYVGAQDQFYTFNMFDAQAWHARDVVLGRVGLPDRAAMRADSEAWVERNAALEDAEQMIDFQTDYMRDLLSQTDYPHLDVDAVARLFKEWERHKAEGILTYRDRSYRSTITGTMAPPHHTVWMAALDDSLEAFLDQPESAAAE